MGATVGRIMAEAAKTGEGPSYRSGGQTYPQDSGWALGQGPGLLPGGPLLWLGTEGPMERSGQLEGGVGPTAQSRPRITLTCVPEGVLSGCGGSDSAAPVCWMNCCRLHCRSSRFSSSSSWAWAWGDKDSQGAQLLCPT